MKVKTIRITGKQVFENLDELEEGDVEIELEAYDILREIDSEDVADYARWSLDMRHEDDFESSLDDFDDDFIEALKYSGYNFSKQIDEDECIEFLEDSGYTVSPSKEENELDNIDAPMLEEITRLFLNSSCVERKLIYNKTFKLCQKD